jgi:hypothetical protein
MQFKPIFQHKSWFTTLKEITETFTLKHLKHTYSIMHVN